MDVSRQNVCIENCMCFSPLPCWYCRSASSNPRWHHCPRNWQPSESSHLHWVACYAWTGTRMRSLWNQGTQSLQFRFCSFLTCGAYWKIQSIQILKTVLLFFVLRRSACLTLAWVLHMRVLACCRCSSHGSWRHHAWPVYFFILVPQCLNPVQYEPRRNKKQNLMGPLRTLWGP